MIKGVASKVTHRYSCSLGSKALLLTGGRRWHEARPNPPACRGREPISPVWRTPGRAGRGREEKNSTIERVRREVDGARPSASHIRPGRGAGTAKTGQTGRSARAALYSGKVMLPASRPEPPPVREAPAG